MRFSDERYQRDLRKLMLARRMALHEARTRTIIEWTGLSRLRVRALCRHELGDFADAIAAQHRGPPARLLYGFMSSPAARSEAGALAASCQLHGVFPADTGDAAVERLPGIERGERLCSAYEGYLAYVPEPRFKFEQALLLVRGLVRGGELVMAQCYSCQSVLVTGRFARGSPYCAMCRTVPSSALRDSRPEPSAEPVALEPRFEQQSLF